ncbi:hypothetical protein KCU85_g1673, partial [Aureobasidium melanogenum]
MIHKAGGQSEVLTSDDKCRVWSKDTFSSSDLSHLITSSIGAVEIKWRDLDKLIITDVPSEKLVTCNENAEGPVNSYKGVFHYLVETIDRVGCSSREVQVRIYHDPKTEAYARKDLIKLLKFISMPVPDFLEDNFLAPPPGNNLGVALKATPEPAAEPDPPTLENNGAALPKEATAGPAAKPNIRASVASNNLAMALNASAATAGTWSFDTLEQAADHGTTAATSNAAASAKVIPCAIPTQLTKEQLPQKFQKCLCYHQAHSRARGIYD